MRTLVLVSGLVWLGLPGMAQGDPFDGKTPLVCAYIQTYECDGEKRCAPGDADDVRLPDFVRIDFGRKKITALDEERRGETTSIDRIAHTEDRLVLQGVEAGRGWTLLLSKEDGDLVLTVADDEDAFIAFGECTRT